MERSETKQKENWETGITERMKGAEFPMDRHAAEERFKGISFEGEDVVGYFDSIDWPVNSQEEFIQKIRGTKGSGREKSTTGIPGLQ